MATDSLHRAWRVHNALPGAIPRLDTVATPACGPGEVRVRVRAFAISFVDLLLIEGGYQWKPPTPFVPGSEFSGVVEACGAGDTHGLHVGDPVCGVRQGAWAETLALPATAVHKLSATAMQRAGADWDTEASALMAPGATALYALRERAQLRPSENLLVLGAAGAVGHAAVQVGKALGARVIAAASSPDKRAAAMAAGADVAVDSSSGAWKDEVKSLCGEPGVGVVFDPVGGDATDTAFRTLGWNGRHLVVGFTSGTIHALKTNLAIVKGASLIGVDYRQAAARDSSVTRQVQADVLRLHAQGLVRPRIQEVLAPAQLAQAFAQVRRRETLGRVVIRLAP
ncbi:NADPH:quinone oxidoreductase family protein [Variovorax sp. Root473]|uniref:NADPH:quinone oxidoreductase family protein n=1 Tax=Variovorax sp. Root473 TaxID=1736541 RepID=UPI000701E27B|nr:NADPH:quinone oxidoreductase family protein [Variovorax sp. Root473]KQX95813.1 hypothetical protein ASD34_00395 [Variovorax sp. Root473]